MEQIETTGSQTPFLPVMFVCPSVELDEDLVLYEGEVGQEPGLSVAGSEVSWDLHFCQSV